MYLLRIFFVIIVLANIIMAIGLKDITGVIGWVISLGFALLYYRADFELDKLKKKLKEKQNAV